MARYCEIGSVLLAAFLVFAGGTVRAEAGQSSDDDMSHFGDGIKQDANRLGNAIERTANDIFAAGKAAVDAGSATFRERQARERRLPPPPRADPPETGTTAPPPQ